MNIHSRRSMADYLQQIADWRRRRAEEYDRDERNLVVAAGLEELAAYILELPDDDERMEILGQVAITHDMFTPGQQTSYEIGRFRFHHADTSLDGFLTHITRLAIADSEERGRFAGRLPEGDDPWAPEWRNGNRPGTLA
jgi:hypothetical protein